MQEQCRCKVLQTSPCSISHGVYNTMQNASDKILVPLTALVEHPRILPQAECTLGCHSSLVYLQADCGRR